MAEGAEHSRAAPRSATYNPITLIGKPFVVSRVKDGLFKGFYILDKRWSPNERREFGMIIDALLNPHNTKGT